MLYDDSGKCVDIKTLRALTGLSQSQFAARFGLTKKSVENWEQGYRTIDPIKLEAIAIRVKKYLKKGGRL